MELPAQSPPQYSHHPTAFQSAIANDDKSHLPPAKANRKSNTMNGNGNPDPREQSVPTSLGNLANLPLAHALPPRPSNTPSYPPWRNQDSNAAEDQSVADLSRKMEGYRQGYAQLHQQPAPAGNAPSQPGFFTGNAPLSNHPTDTPPFVGSYAGAQPGILGGSHPLSHWFTGQVPLSSATSPPNFSGGGLSPFFNGNLPPFAGANAMAQPFGQFPGPPPLPPCHQQPPPGMSQPFGHGSRPGGVNEYDPPTPTAPREQKKDSKIHLPAPIPTQAYLKQASLQAEVRYPPALKLVVLDLNGTLLYRPNARKQPRKMVARPFLRQFLTYLFDNFAVMVWSSAKPENVKVLVEIGLGEFEKQLVTTWGRDTLGLEPRHYNMNVQCYKNLERIWSANEIQAYMPGYVQGARFDQRNTILIDDSSLKAAAQPHNLLEIPEFKGVEPGTPVQDVLSEVVGYLEVLKMQEDVSKFIHKQPFRANGDWKKEWDELDLQHAPAVATAGM